ncbi:acetyl-CoA carboxylase biotin carboxyl carrier protein subunit [Pelagibacteraceae bacterium]|nr:acetyl-CoA carboxylase biotin carboxyl carrier protein subunit [Pelagibacteraceae bacterium]
MKNKDSKFIDKKSIKELVEILDEMSLSSLSYQKADVSISVSKANVATIATSNNNETVPTQIEETDYRNDPRVIKSPMVGTVYLQPEPGAKLFVEKGDSIAAGQTLLIIEAMKTMNPIESNLQGKITKIFVENEEAVEFGQPLMLVE